MAEDPQPPVISIVLPAYVPTPLFEMTQRCLWSLNDTTDRLSYQLVVVENGSYHLWDTWSEAFGDVYLHYNEPLGYARAANIGMAVARHDWILVLNTDLEFKQKGWLPQLQKDYESTVGGVLSAMDDDRWGGITYNESWFSCWLTHRDVIRKVGYFDESMGYRFHDQDYAIRVKSAGYEVMRSGNVHVNHIDSATYDTMGRNNDPEEEAQMVRRWNARDFKEWMSKS